MLYVLGSAENPITAGASYAEPISYRSPDGALEIAARDLDGESALPQSTTADHVIVILHGSGQLRGDGFAEPFDKGDVLLVEREALSPAISSSGLSVVEIKLRTGSGVSSEGRPGTNGGRLLVARQAETAFQEFGPDKDHTGEMTNRVSLEYTSSDELFHFGFQDFRGSKSNPAYDGMEMVHVILSGSGTWHIAGQQFSFSEGDVVVHESPLAEKTVVSDHHRQMYLWRWRSQAARAHGAAVA